MIKLLDSALKGGSALEENSYVFACARVRGSEKNLMSKEQMEKMLEAKTPAEALKILLELEYGSGQEQVAPENFERLLAWEQKKTYEFIMSIAPEKTHLLMFAYANDYHNLKTLLKAEFLNIDASESLSPVGTIEPMKMAALVRERNFLPFTSEMKDAFNEAVDLFSRSNDPQTIDLVLDKACYADMGAIAEEAENDFLTGYVKLLIDTINLKTFVRLRQMGKPWDFFLRVFINGGNISEKLFVEGYDEPFLQFAERLHPYGMQGAMTEGGAILKNTGKFTVFEKCCDNKLIDYVKNAKYVYAGIEPLVAFLVAKENEIRNARIIMAGKLAGLSSELIRERLRETYA